MSTIITGDPPGPYTLVFENNGSITCPDAVTAQTYCPASDWAAFVASQTPKYTAWTALLTAFQATTPTITAMNAWLASNPPFADS